MTNHNKKSNKVITLEEPYTGASYRNISSLLYLQNTDQKSNHLSFRWEQWLNRFRFYRSVDDARVFDGSKYEAFLDWQDNRKKIWRQEKLYEKLLALDEFYKIRHHLDPKVAHDLHESLIRLINIELTKLEIDQLRKLEKAEQIKRTAEIEEHRQALLIDKQYIKKYLVNRRVSFLDYFNTENPSYTHLNKVLSARESKIPYSRILHKTEDLNNGFSIINSGLDLFVRIVAAGYLGVIKFSQSFVDTLSSIPIISIALTGIHLTLKLIKSFAQKKSSKTVLSSIVVLGIVGAALVGASFAPVAGAFIASALVSLVYTTQHLLPWVAMRRKISFDTEHLNDAINRFNLIADRHHQLVLTGHEKNLVIRELERYCVKLANNGDKRQLQASIKLIHDAKNHTDVMRLEKNPLIRAMLVNNNQSNLKGIVVRESQVQLRRVRVDLQALKAYEKEHRWKVGTGFLGVVGAVLLCIPTPITWVVGASLLTTSTVIGIGLKYRAVSRAITFFKEKFSNKKVVDPILPERDEPVLTNTFVRKNLMQVPAQTIASATTQKAAPVKSASVKAAGLFADTKCRGKNKDVLAPNNKPVAQL